MATVDGMALGKDYATQECSIARALEVVGERWTLLVIRDALYGVRRYNDFLVHLGIPRAVLANRLQALTAEGILEKRRYQESPTRDEYVLTERGIALWPALRALGIWGREQLGGEPMRTFWHADCGTSSVPTAPAPPAAPSSPCATSTCGRAPDSPPTRRTRSAGHCSVPGGCSSRSRPSSGVPHDAVPHDAVPRRPSCITGANACTRGGSSR